MAQQIGSAPGGVDEGIYGGLGGAGGELVMDVRRADQVWLRKSRSLIHISSSCEDRDVWKFTLRACLQKSSLRGGEGRSSPSSGATAARKHGGQPAGDEPFLDKEFEH